MGPKKTLCEAGRHAGQPDGMQAERSGMLFDMLTLWHAFCGSGFGMLFDAVSLMVRFTYGTTHHSRWKGRREA
jgi:hypothetical protein